MSVFDLNKIKSVLDDALHDDHQITATSTHPPNTTHSTDHTHKKSGLGEKIKDILDGDDEERKKEEELLRLKTEKEKAEALEKIKEARGLTGKVEDFLDHGEARKKQEAAEIARIDAKAKDEHDNLLGVRGKILDVLDGPDKHPAVSKPGAEHGLKDKVKELWGGKPTNVPKEEDIGDKILDVLGSGGKEKKQKKQDQKNWFENKVREMAGGGKAGELDEDKLDKAVDLFQQHILKQGRQSDESAIEQLKDEQIAGAIRASFKSVTGHEIPKE